MSTATIDPDTGEVTLVPLALNPEATIAARMVAILTELPALGKGEWNEQQKFHYRSHDQVLNALNPLLAKHGVVVIPDVMERIPGERTTSGGKTMYEINLHVRFRFFGLAGDWFDASAWGEGTDMGDKATNKAMTMAFKNVLAQAFAVSTAESYDTDGQSPQETTRPGVATQEKPSGGRTGGQRTRRTFDPGVDLAEGAIDGQDAPKRIANALASIDPTIDWKATLLPAIAHTFNVATREEIPADRLSEFWRRMSNMVEKITREFPPDAMPPAEEQDIQEAVAWAFGVSDPKVIEIQVVEAVADAEAAIAAETAAAAYDDQIPFGDAAPTGEHKDPQA